jgi:hypothetical protein
MNQVLSTKFDRKELLVVLISPLAPGAVIVGEPMQRCP